MVRAFTCLLVLQPVVVDSINIAMHTGDYALNASCNVGKGKWKKTWHAQAYRSYHDNKFKLSATGDGGPHLCNVGDFPLAKSVVCPENQAWKWKWVPDECELAPLDGPWLRMFTQRKHMAFLGDSLMQNIYMSLRCMMHTQVNHMDYFPSFRFGAQKNDEGNVDLADVSIAKVFSRGKQSPNDYSVLVINGGQHFGEKELNYTKNGKPIVTAAGGNHVATTYRVALRRIFKQLEKAGYKRDVVLMTWIPHHPKGEAKCMDLDEKHLKKIAEVNTMLAEESAQQYSFKVTLLDVTTMTLGRPDGHPTSELGSDMDCTHWCNPGVPDTWNKALLHSLRGIASNWHMTI